MKRLFYLTGLASLVLGASLQSCSSDDDYLMPSSSQLEAGEMMSRSTDAIRTITFETASSSQMANPTSYGDNLYGTVTINGKTWNHVTGWYNSSSNFYTQFNDMNGGQFFYNGGIAVSNWKIDSQPTDSVAGWWYSYKNQCSVYNPTSTHAGHSGSKFAIVYGYEDSYNQAWMSMPSFSFRSQNSADTTYLVEHKLNSMYVCNSSYTYGVIRAGNSWSDTNPNDQAASLEKSKGWFKLILHAYNKAGQEVAGSPKEFYLADYRDGSSTKVNAIYQWTKWDLNLSNVATVKFNFTGSDSGIYGLNTPAYVCIDDIEIE